MATNGKRRRGWRWVALAVAALVAGLLARWWLWPSETPPPARDARAAPPAPPGSFAAPTGGSLALSTPVAAVAAAPEFVPPGTTPERPADAPPVTLPPTTQVLAEEFFPGTTEWEDVPVDNARQYQLRILPLRYNVVAPMPIAVLLEVVDRSGRRQPLSLPRVRVRALEDESRPWIDVPVRDDGSGADKAANDFQYTATLQPSDAQKKALLGRVLVEASVDFPGTGTRTIPATLIYTLGPRARLTGRWTDSVRDGHLELGAEVEVEEGGVFTLMAQLFGPSMEPIAWVKQMQRMERGRGTLTLQVFGKVLHDAGVDGPYRVRQVLLTRSRDNSGDYDPGVTIEEAHRTKPYSARDFSSAVYQEPPRVIPEEITAEHPSQRGKPGPEKTRTLAR